MEVLARLEHEGAAARLRLQVRNTGAPLGTDLGTAGGRVGLANVEHRLAGHYGGSGSFALHGEAGWTVADIVLPVDVERRAMVQPRATAR